MSRTIRIAIAVLALGTLAACHTINHVPPGQAKKVVAPPPGQAKKAGGY
jgi:hypothetical protein